MRGALHVIVITLLVGAWSGCREPTWVRQTFVANRSSEPLELELSILRGGCQDLWELRPGLLREDDFRAGDDDPHVTVSHLSIPPGTVAPLGGCAARLSFDLQSHAVIWDPGLEAIERVRRPSRVRLFHPQTVAVVDGDAGRELSLGASIEPLELIPAHEPVDPGPCADLVGPPIEASASGQRLGGTLLSITEHGDGCMTLELSGTDGGLADPDEGDGGSPGDDTVAAVDDDAGIAPEPSGIGRPRVFLCVPRELLPVEPGMEVTIDWDRDGTQAYPGGLVIRPADRPRPRLALMAARVDLERLSLPRSVLPGDPAYGNRTLDAVVRPADCGWVREGPGRAHRVMQVSLAGHDLSYGDEVTVQGVTYISRRALRQLFADRPGAPGTVYHWIEVHHDDEP